MQTKIPKTPKQQDQHHEKNHQQAQKTLKTKSFGPPQNDISWAADLLYLKR